MDPRSSPQLDSVVKENKELKQRLEGLERDNRALKKSVYDLSVRMSVLLSRRRQGMATTLADLDGPVGELEDTQEEDAGAAAAAVWQTLLEGSGRERSDGRRFRFKRELRGHLGAVYALQYSPCGRLLASGSFDRSVRLWDTLMERPLGSLEGHELAVSDVAWSTDSRLVLSGSYDQTCRIWDADTHALVSSTPVEGFVQTVGFRSAEGATFACGTTESRVILVDTRQAGAAMTMHNDAMVNSLYVYRDGTTILTGDAGGLLKRWDLRSGECFDSVLNGSCSAISHVHVSAASSAEEEGRYLGVNAYDNVSRVYDRGAMPPRTSLQLVVACRGHISKNWPVRGAFFTGREFRPDASVPDAAMVATASGGGAAAGGALANGGGADGDEEAEDVREAVAAQPRSLSASLILATGSVDGNVFVYDVGTGGRGGSVANGVLLQRLEGHAGRVYSSHFHPHDPILCTGASDHTIRIWAARPVRTAAPPPP